jgi:hypothetical protein
MPVKNTNAKSWVIQPSFDGKKWSKYPLGDKPTGFQTTPILLKTDIVSGSNVNGENNKGAYLSLFGYGFGIAANLGTATGARVYIGGVEVDNYRALITSRTYQVNQVQQIIVQVGALAGLTAGVDYPVTVEVNGVTSVNPTGYTNNFMIQPGNFYFVATTGNDSTALVNDINRPYRYVQNITQHASGSDVVIDSVNGIWSTLQPGDTIVIRGGNYSDITGYEGRWCRYYNNGVKPSAPTGSVGHGYIHFTRYPGTVLGNTPEDVHYTLPAETNSVIGRSGGIQGGSSNASLRGYGYYTSISGLRFTGVANGSSDGGPTDFQSSGKYWRVFDCEIGPWYSGGTDYKDSGTGGVGERAVMAFNYIHDIEGSPSALQNHGIYMGGIEGGTGYVSGSQYCEIAYNWVKNIPGGSSIQFNFAANNAYLKQNVLGATNNGSGAIRIQVPTMTDSSRSNDGTFNAPSGAVMPTNAWVRISGVGGTTEANGFWKITYVDSTHFDLQGSTFTHAYTSGGYMEDVTVGFIENKVHHNFLDTCAKSGITCGPGSYTCKSWNNIILNSGTYALRSQPSQSTAPDIHIMFSHNLVYNPVRNVTEMECNLSTGELIYQHNIFVNGPNTDLSFGAWRNDYNGGGADPNDVTVYDRNLYFDTRGVITTKQSDDTNGSYGDPLFKDISIQDFTLLTGSPALNAATSTEIIPVADDIYGIIRSLSTPTIGPTEGVGT